MAQGHGSAEQAQDELQPGVAWAHGFKAATVSFAADWLSPDLGSDSARAFVAAMDCIAALALPAAELKTYLEAHHPPGATAPAAGMAERMATMDAHMKSMREMHDRMTRARTPEERQALMAEHMKLMQEGMSMMGGMAPGKAPANAVARQQMMEKRMDMMQSMMQMMMDRMPMSSAAPGK